MLGSIKKLGNDAVPVGTDEAVLGYIQTSQEFREILIAVRPAGCNLADVVVDLLPAGGDPLVDDNWIPFRTGGDFAATSIYDIRSNSNTPIDGAQDGEWAFSWLLVPPCEGIRVRATADGDGTCEFSMGLGRE
jgi:hypothetical protein